MRYILYALLLFPVLSIAQGQSSQGVDTRHYAQPEANLKDWGTGRWSTAATFRQTLYGALRYYDMAQSRTMAKNPDQWMETGYLAKKLYGEHPSVSEVHKTGLLFFASVWFIAYQLDEPARGAWQWTNIGFEAGAVNNNRKTGIKPDWPLLNVGIRF